MNFFTVSFNTLDILFKGDWGERLCSNTFCIFSLLFTYIEKNETKADFFKLFAFVFQSIKCYYYEKLILELWFREREIERFERLKIVFC